jgi:hypothetical protein
VLAAHLNDKLGYQDNRKIIVRVYVNIFDLARVYARSRLVGQAQTVRDFYGAFNREFPFFEFVDVGGDKEAADKKITGQCDTRIGPKLSNLI